MEKMKNEIQLNNIDFTNATEDFVTYLDVDKETLRCYKEGVKKFLEYLKNIEVKYPTREHIRAFREELSKTNSIYTVNSYLTSLRRFFDYLEDNNLYENITRSVKSLKASKVPVRQTLTVEQCKTIYKNLVDKREKALFSLSLSTGLRGIEISRAKIEDIKLHNGEVVLWVQPKKHDSKDFYVKLSDEVIRDIKEYVGDRKEGYIFTSNSYNNCNGGLTTTSIRNIMKSIFRRYGFDEKGFSMHSTRRTFATIAYNNDTDIYSIQQVLGHHSITTTQRYIQQVTRNNNKTELKISNLLFE